MLKFEKLRARLVLMSTVLVLAGTLSSGAAVAGAVVGATEITQILNNIQLLKVSMDSALTATTTVKKYMVQLDQYKNQMINTVGVDPSALAANVRDLNTTYQQVASYERALSGLGGSLDAQSKMYDRRLLEAKLKNLSFKDYAVQASEDARLGNERAKARLENEQAILRQVDADYAFAREKQSEIPAALGHQQSLGLMNSQMNKLVTQNAQVIAILARAQNQETPADIKAQNAEVKANTEYEKYQALQKAVRARQLEMMKQ